MKNKESWMDGDGERKEDENDLHLNSVDEMRAGWNYQKTYEGNSYFVTQCIRL